MEPRYGSFLSFSGLLGASLLIHATALYSFEPLIGLHNTLGEKIQTDTALKTNKRERIELEYIEAPKSAPAVSPKKTTRKISSRDAVAQDLLRVKRDIGKLPAIVHIGGADQLAQKEGPVPRAGIVPSKPAPPQPPAAAGFTPQPAKPSEGPKPGANSVQKSPAENQPPRPSSPAQAPAEGGGGDKITTQETAKTRSSGARFYGLTSFEATGSGMGVYMKNLKEKIWVAWYPYLAFKYPQDMQAADAVLSIVLDKKGEVRIVRLLESKGSPLFAAYCMEAVQRASGFGPLPQEILALIGKDELELKFAFHYL